MNIYTLVFSVVISIVCSTAQAYTADKKACEKGVNSRFVFSWPISDECDNTPRGGTSRGIDVTVDEKPHSGWLAIQEQKLSKFEKDRQAILAMSGPYKVNFDFLETVGYSESFERDRPYQSWGTEYVYVIEDTGAFISLQHVMVMYFSGKEGAPSEPMVMKHWRQDWTYQDKELLEYQHRGQWQTRKLPRKERTGSWSQAVFQVDDSPRYESYGHWQHNSSFSTWLSETTRRPLPRREYSIRNDYQVLEGFNRHTITRTGWVQEEENWKLVLDEAGNPSATEPYLSKELGVARYRRIVGTDFGPGDRYVKATESFWSDVRSEWASVIQSSKTLSLKKKVNGLPLFMPLFEYAAQIEQDQVYDSMKGKEFIQKLIKSYVK